MINSTLCYLERKSISGEPEVLLLHRVKKKNDLNHDKWIGIGGKFEEGESPEDCLLRETREETGLTLTSWQYRGIVTFVTTNLPERNTCIFLRLTALRESRLNATRESWSGFRSGK